MSTAGGIREALAAPAIRESSEALERALAAAGCGAGDLAERDDLAGTCGT